MSEIIFSFLNAYEQITSLCRPLVVLCSRFHFYYITLGFISMAHRRWLCILHVCSCFQFKSSNFSYSLFCLGELIDVISTWISATQRYLSQSVQKTRSFPKLEIQLFYLRKLNAQLFQHLNLVREFFRARSVFLVCVYGFGGKCGIPRSSRKI